VKLSLFTEVQCPPSASPLRRLEEALEQAQLADALGFHGFWLSEIHFQPEFSVLSTPYLVLGALSQRTRRLRLGVAVNILPVHHPVHVAEQVAMLDLLSHGRAEFAFGRGHVHSRVYEGFGVDRASSRAMMEESLRVILAAWTQDLLEFEGSFYRIPEIVPNPKPLQKPHPPVYSATSSLDGAEFTARLGLNLLLPVHLMPRDRLRSYAAAYWNGLRSHGHDAAGRELGLLVPVHVAETSERAREDAGAGIMDYYRVIAETRDDYARWLARRGLDAGQEMSPRQLEELTFERICAEHAVVSEPDTAVAALRRLGEETGATHLLCWMNIGSVPHNLVIRSMERFAREVMPRLATTAPEP
jgi:alkanesulfonate monooxygenase SsuD/methylene tetrahydromethanopterin reductase-like flavin-dependent oxidoreductase (luciferase family)